MTFRKKNIFCFSTIQCLALWIGFLLPNSADAQTMTKPLFMQIKTPELESRSGSRIPYTTDHFYITTNNDSVDISFVIRVPKDMLSEKWAVSLSPSVVSTYDARALKSVIIKGWKFAEEQDDDYEKYEEYINSIVDSSMYEKSYIDQKRLEREIEHRHDEYWQYYYDEWERQIAFEIWKSQQDGSIKTYFIKDKSDYSDQLKNQYLLRIENQSKRYLKAKMDTTGLYSKYMKEFKEHDAKMPRFFVNNTSPLRKVPTRFKDISKSGRTLSDITNAMLDLLVKRDSALMSLPVLDYGKIVENEKRSMLQDGIFNDMVRVPKSENSLLDTVVYNIHRDYEYLYTYRYPVYNKTDTVKVKLHSRILATDRSGYSTTSENILTYVISRAPSSDTRKTLPSTPSRSTIRSREDTDN